MPNIKDTIALMKEISNQNSEYLITGNSNAFLKKTTKPELTLTKVTGDLKKRAIYLNYKKVADRLDLNPDSKQVGKNFITCLVNKTHTNPDVNLYPKQTALEGVYASFIESFSKDIIRDYNAVFINGFLENENEPLSNNLTKEFEKNIDSMTPEKINEEIADKVMDATSKFIDRTNKKNEKIKEIYTKTKNFISGSNSEKDNKAAQEAAKRMTSVINELPHTEVFDSLIHGLANSITVNEHMANRYIDESNTLNMRNLIEDASAIYAVFECANTFGLVDVNKQLTDEFIKGLQA